MVNNGQDMIVIVVEKRRWCPPQVSHLISLDSRFFEHLHPFSKRYPNSIISRRKFEVAGPGKHLLHDLRKALVLLSGLQLPNDEYEETFRKGQNLMIMIPYYHFKI